MGMSQHWTATASSAAFDNAGDNATHNTADNTTTVRRSEPDARDISGMGRRARRRLRPSWRRVGGVAFASAAGLLILAGPASAHVKVFSPDAVPGQAATLQFRVPSEEAAATTIRVAVDLPAGVSVNTVPDLTGWTSSSAPDAAGGTLVTWTVTDPSAAIAPDDRRYFDVQTKLLPQQDSLTFTVTQTYSDGSVIMWNQPPTSAGEPQYPAPTLALVGARPGGAPDDPAHAATTSAAHAGPSPASSLAATAGAVAAGPSARSSTAEDTTSTSGFINGAVAATGTLAGVGAVVLLARRVTIRRGKQRATVPLRVKP